MFLIGSSSPPPAVSSRYWADFSGIRDSSNPPALYSASSLRPLFIEPADPNLFLVSPRPSTLP